MGSGRPNPEGLTGSFRFSIGSGMVVRLNEVSLEMRELSNLNLVVTRNGSTSTRVEDAVIIIDKGEERERERNGIRTIIILFLHVTSRHIFVFLKWGLGIWECQSTVRQV